MNNLNKKLILASNSPRRKEILKENGFIFDVFPSCYDEKISGKKYDKNLVENCAYNKALDVFERINDKNAVIISADTVVVLNDLILGKPKDKKDAFETLKSLSSKTHFVATSFCILYFSNSQNKITTLKDTQITTVTFRKLENDEILNYINTKNPLDKAGSYGIQDENFDFAIKIKGEYENIVGFPIKLFKIRFGELF